LQKLSRPDNNSVTKFRSMPKKSSKTIQEKTKKKVSKKEEEKETKGEEKDEEEEKEEDEKDEVVSPAKVFHFEGALDEAFNSEVEETPIDPLAAEEDSDEFSEEEMGNEWEE